MANRLGSNPSLTAYHRTPFFGSRHTLQSGTLTNKPARLVYKTQATAAVPLETSTPTSATASLESVPLEDFQEPSATPFNWKDHWYPVVFERDVGPSQLYNFTLLGVPIVIWPPSPRTSQRGSYRAKWMLRMPVSRLAIQWRRRLHLYPSRRRHFQSPCPGYSLSVRC